MRQLASIQEIVDIKAIEGADLICAYQVLGWWVVDQVNKYAIGDRVIYLEIDAFIPNHIAPFLSKGKEPRLYNGIRGERLRTIKLKKQLSQGLLLPLEVLTFHSVEIATLRVGTDVSEMLNILKYEPPLPSDMGAKLGGRPKGNFPTDIPKTDETRIQSLVREFASWQDDLEQTWTVTEKADGSSCTIYYRPTSDEFGVCSRNFDLTQTDENTFWQVAIKENLETKLRDYGKHIALQGEVVGDGIQKNRYKISGHEFLLFNVFDIDTQTYYHPHDTIALAKTLGINHVPVIEENASLPPTLDEILEYADGKSKINYPCTREGLVYKSNTTPGQSFKAISNAFLLKSGD